MASRHSSATRKQRVQAFDWLYKSVPGLIQTICVYCGDVSDTLDHVYPLAAMPATQLLPKSALLTVPCCSECNTLANATVCYSPVEKMFLIRGMLRRRHRAVLKIPHWTAEQIAEMGHKMQTFIRKGLREQKYVRSRLDHTMNATLLAYVTPWERLTALWPAGGTTGEAGIGADEVGSCRLAKRPEQRQKMSRGRLITHDGRRRRWPAWARETGLTASTINCRLKRHWTPEQALTEPVGPAAAASHRSNLRMLEWRHDHRSRNSSVRERHMEIGAHAWRPPQGIQVRSIP